MKYKKIQIAFACFLLAALTFFTSCDPNENPTCKTVTLTLNKTADGYKATHTITDNISNDSRLKKIILKDHDGWKIDEIVMNAPETSGRKPCACHFPDPYYSGGSTYRGNGFVETTSGGTTVYTAENGSQTISKTIDMGHHDYTLTTTSEGCPVGDHMGNWELNILYPLSVGSDELISKELEVCFEWEE